MCDLIESKAPPGVLLILDDVWYVLFTVVIYTSTHEHMSSYLFSSLIFIHHTYSCTITYSKTIHAESKGADDKFVQKATEFHGGNPHFKAGGSGFVIQHYAGKTLKMLYQK